MKSNRQQRHSRSRSHSSSNRSRSRDRNDKPDRNKYHHQYNYHPDSKLYLTNIPINYTTNQIKEEFEKFGKVIDYSFRKKNDTKNPYYFGYITLSKKIEAEQAMEYIPRNLKWKVVPFEKNDKNKNTENKNKEDDILSSDEEKQINNQQNNQISAVKVREIWVGDLPNDTNESNLYKAFFIYGEISKIEIKPEKKCAFIKFRLVSSASRAYEKAKNMIFNGNKIKISFSNSAQRKDVIGDEEGYELTENNCKLIHIALSKNCEPNKEENIYPIFEKFGKIKNIATKCSPPFRPSIYVEFYKNEDAKNAINNLSKEDKQILGDENCEINFYFKKKSENINEYPKVQNQTNQQQPNSNLYQNNNLLFNKMMVFPNNMGMNFVNNPLLYQMMQQQQKNLVNNNINNLNDNKQYNNPLNNNLNIPLINNTKFPFPYMRPAIYPGLFNYQQPLNNYQNQLPFLFNNPTFGNNLKNQMMPNKETNNKNNNQSNNQISDVKDLIHKIMEDKNNQNNNKNNSDSDISSLNGSQSAEEMDFEKEYSLEEENLKYIWNGFLTKNNRDRVNVDLYQIRGKIDDSYFKEYHLNVCNRITYEEVMKRHLLGIVAISPQNVTQREVFDEYVKYLNEKQRCGVINVSEKYILYLVSPGEFSRKFYQNPKKHLLGLLVDATVEPNLYVDMNNLALPPPVISLTEKRKLMNKNKKNENESKKDNKLDDDIINKLKEKLQNMDNNDKNIDNMKNLDELIDQNPDIKEIIERLSKKINK